MPGTVRLHRVLVTTPDKVYRAFIEPDAYARWIPPNGFTGKVHEMDPKVGGKYRMSFTNFTTGNGQSFGGEYTDLQPGQRVQYKSIFDDPALAGDMVTTIDIKAVPVGTEISIVQEGIPDVIPESGCYLGWQESLLNLARLVEPEIPD
ncbi:SRPBCC family protein [Hyphomonas chukchiensis]|uniref:Activator of Hsp90 ATPase homologue 1/2-like C-terminal domain-containing protein n=1 Tax=Hyphomonas chukchiensis TaxID=1280947 RepID=A0A062USU7_9PROT|nr:SRPBCC family protein [Hyphomonas chukchiensis]KCZ61321.1 hypothetical protein HY30_02970 [Hyphomonas chukchiensis]